MDKLQAMQVFVRVVETGGITRAADSLHMPKATAATLIQKLEATLGVKLLNRTTRHVSVTPDGAAYYDRCVSILAEVRETEELLGKQQSTPRGRVRVDVPTLMARSVFVPALPKFFERYPEIELALASNERRADLIEEGIDCAVWSGEIEESSLVARRVGFLYFATCAAPAYIAAHGQPLHPDDLAQHRCINHFSPRSGKTVDWVFSKDGTRVQTSLRGNIALEDENSYVAAAEAGPWHRADPRLRAEGSNGARHARAGARGLVPRSVTAVRGVSAEPASLEQGARVRRLGGGVAART